MPDLEKYITEKEKIAYLEGMAEGIWKVFLGIDCDRWDYCKSYDPLTIEIINSKIIGHSYIFNFHDGGRHHNFVTFERLYNGLMEEIKLQMPYKTHYSESNKENTI